jgi:hypothetical protein
MAGLQSTASEGSALVRPDKIHPAPEAHFDPAARGFTKKPINSPSFLCARLRPWARSGSG